MNYLEVYWPNLLSKFEGKSYVEIAEHLDIVTCLKTPIEAMPKRVAVGRWYGALKRMYAVNGDLEF